MKKLLFVSLILLSGICAHAQTWNIGSPNAADVVATLSNDTLYIRGTGDMQNIPSPNPWQNSGITHAVIEPGVTKIGNGAFLNCADLTSVDITEDVTSIGIMAFQGCSALMSIDIPENIASIEPQTFNGCSSLTSIIIPDNVTSIGSSAIKGCTALTSIVIPDNVTSIGNDAFSGCNSLASVIIPESVINIGGNAFLDCSALTSIVIPENVTSIKVQTFMRCSSLTSVTIPDNVTTVEANAFTGCWGLTSITIPENISLGNMVFASCSSLTSVVIPENVTIGEGLFYACSNLTSVTLPEDATSIPEQTFMQCYNLASITIPENVTTIGSSAFSGCQALTTIEIPENVTTIGNYAFTSCSGIASITIPRSVTTIGDYIIANCISLNAVINLNPIPQSVNPLSLSPPLGNMTLTVPCGSLSAYQNAPVWQDFGTIVENCPKTGVTNVKANFSCPGQVTVNYDLGTTDPVDVTLYYSPDGGKTWLLAQTVSGDLSAQETGAGKTITWDNRADNVKWGKFKLKVEVPQPKPKCPDGVEINDVCWAKYNVNAPGTFTQNPEDAGMFYQWNRQAGWSATDPLVSTNGSLWIVSSDTGTTWERTNDPCPTGFRLPSATELQNLSTVSNAFVINYKNTGVNGRLFTDGANELFLPATDYRDCFGQLQNTFSYQGQYWGQGASILEFRSGPTSVNWNNLPILCAGQSVRCVKE
ncbi:MAG: leucine-rich repeat domain-containing protein [Prevotellaceae bacterium]|jgi:hypothetical protein|nr:leucine-rich repeat domain-containing protein [Prevotellaceae bacterium]